MARKKSSQTTVVVLEQDKDEQLLEQAIESTEAKLKATPQPEIPPGYTLLEAKLRQFRVNRKWINPTEILDVDHPIIMIEASKQTLLKDVQFLGSVSLVCLEAVGCLGTRSVHMKSEAAVLVKY